MPRTGIVSICALIGIVTATAVAPDRARAGGNQSDNHAAAYNRIGVGARALGMGGAYTAAANDPTAVMWNPAGISRIDRYAATYMHTFSYDYDRSHDFFGCGVKLPVPYCYAGLGYTRAGWDDFTRRSGLGIGDSNFDLTDQLYAGALAFRYGPAAVGFSGKSFQQEIDDEKQTGGGVDLGMFIDVNRWITLAAAAQDVYSKIGDEDVPYNIRAGGYTYWERLDAVFNYLLVSYDLEHGEDDETVFHVGGELGLVYPPGWYWAARGGVSDLGRDYQDEGWSLGGGVKLARFHWIGVDYAYVNEMEEFLGSNHRVSFNLGK